MSGKKDIKTFYDKYNGENGQQKAKYPNVGLAYTCNCGWIDAGHANPTNDVTTRGADNLWKAIEQERGWELLNGMDGYKVSYEQYAELAALSSVVYFQEAKDYFVKHGLDRHQKERVALSIFKEVSLGFEAQQGAGILGGLSETLGTGSSFSSEDLISNLMGFYHAVRKIRWQDTCGIVSREAAIKIWDTHGAVGNNKVKDFTPKLHNCDECKTAQAFHAIYTSIKSIAKGEWHFDYDKDSTSLKDRIWTPYMSDVLETKQMLGGKPFDNTVKLKIRQGEVQYHFYKRALMVAAYLYGLPYDQQVEFTARHSAKIEYWKFRLSWITDPSPNDGTKRIQNNEFQSGRNLTYELSKDETLDLQRMSSR